MHLTVQASAQEKLQVPTLAPPRTHKGPKSPGSPASHPIRASFEADGSDLEDHSAFASPQVREALLLLPRSVTLQCCNQARYCIARYQVMT